MRHSFGLWYWLFGRGPWAAYSAEGSAGSSSVGSEVAETGLLSLGTSALASFTTYGRPCRKTSSAQSSI